MEVKSDQVQTAEHESDIIITDNSMDIDTPEQLPVANDEIPAVTTDEHIYFTNENGGAPSPAPSSNPHHLTHANENGGDKEGPQILT